MRKPLLGVLTLALLAAACAPVEPGVVSWTERRPVIAEVGYGHVVHFETDRAELEPAERESLRAFLASLPEEGRLAATVAGHADERASDTYNLALSARRTRHVADLLRRLGVERVEIERRALGEAQPVDPRHEEAAWARNRRVEITVRRWSVDAPECGEWDRSGAVHGQQLIPDLGCATTANLVSMIADPADLADGRPLGPADGTREAEAIVRYRADKVKRPLPDEQKP